MHAIIAHVTMALAGPPSSNRSTLATVHKTRWQATYIKLSQQSVTIRTWNVHTLNKCCKLRELTYLGMQWINGNASRKIDHSIFELCERNCTKCWREWPLLLKCRNTTTYLLIMWAQIKKKTRKKSGVAPAPSSLPQKSLELCHHESFTPSVLVK